MPIADTFPSGLRPQQVVGALAIKQNRRHVLSAPARATEMGRAGRARAIESFSWAAIADRTVEVYRSVL